VLLFASYALARLVAPITLITTTLAKIVFLIVTTIALSASLSIFITLIAVLNFIPAFRAGGRGLQVSAFVAT